MSKISNSLEDNLNLQHCLSDKELEERHMQCDNYVALVTTIITANIKKAEHITIFEDMVGSPVIFAYAMDSIGKTFAEEESIEVIYEKPEEKNPNSPYYGSIRPKIEIINHTFISEKDNMKTSISALQEENQKLKKTIQKLFEKKV